MGSTITLIQQAWNARDRVKDASKTLNSLSKQLDSLNCSLSLIRDEKAVQTTAGQQQVRGIAEVAQKLRSSLDVLAVEQQKRSIPQLIHSLKSRDKEDKQLADILGQLDRVRDLLVLQVSVAQVGVIGNLEEGFSVAFGMLMDTNKKINVVLGTKLVLAEQLQNRELQQTEGTVPLDPSDLETLRLVDPYRDIKPGRAEPGSGETSIYDNITVGQARIMTGNIGAENWYRTAGRKTTIAGNKFGQDVRIMTGDQGGDAARGFNESFWNSTEIVSWASQYPRHNFVLCQGTRCNP